MHAIKESPLPIASEVKFIEGTMAGRSSSFANSDEYRGRAAKTKQNAKRIFDYLKTKCGAGRLRDLTPKNTKGDQERQFPCARPIRIGAQSPPSKNGTMPIPRQTCERKGAQSVATPLRSLEYALSSTTVIGKLIGSVGRSTFLRCGECGSRDGFGAMRVVSGPAGLLPAERQPAPPARSTDRWQVLAQLESSRGQFRRNCRAKQDLVPSSFGPKLSRHSRSARRLPAHRAYYAHGPPGPECPGPHRGE